MELFKIFGTIAIQSADAEAGMEKAKSKAKETASSMEKSFSKIGDAAVKCGKIIATGLAAGAAAVGALAKKALDSYGDYEQLAGGSKLLFGDAYDYIADKAANAYATVQMSTNDYLQQVNGFATGLKTALGGDAQAAAELADRIITAEADIVAATGNSQEAVQNAFNGIMKSNFSMLDNLQLGITPTKEGFQEVIDKVNDWNKANGEATAYQIDNLADCQNALVDYVAMQGLADYAANEAAETIQGSLSAVKASWQNLLTGIASDDADIGQLVGNLTSTVTTAAHNIVPRLSQILGGLSTALGQIIPVIAAELPGLIEGLLPQLLAGALSLVNGLISALPGLVSSIASAIPALLPQLISGVIAAIVSLCSNFGDIIQPIIDSLPDTIMSITEALIENLPILLEGVISLVMGIVEALPVIIQTLTDMTPQIIEMVVSALITCSPQLLMGFIQLFIGVIQALPTLLFAPIQGACEGIVGTFDGIKNGVSELLAPLKGKFDELLVQPIENAKEKIRSVIDAIKGFFDFQISWPHIPLPHFSITPAGWKVGDLLKGVKPELGIEWYAKAMDNPMIMNDPTIFGYNPETGNMMGGGEKGAEVVSGANTLMNMISGAVQNENAAMIQRMERIIDLLVQFFPDALQAMQTPMVCDTNGLAIAMAPTMDTELGRLAIKKGRGR